MGLFFAPQPENKEFKVRVFPEEEKKGTETQGLPEKKTALEVGAELGIGIFKGEVSKLWNETKDNYEAAFERSAKIENSIEGRIDQDIIQEESDRIFNETGERLDLEFVNLRAEDAELPFGLFEDKIDTAKKFKQDELDTKIKKIKEKFPNFNPPTRDDIQKKVKERAKEIDQRAERLGAEAGVAGTLGQIAGDVMGGFTDPVNVGLTVATAPIGGFATLSLAKVALREAALNAGIEATEQFTFVQKRREELELPFGTDRALQATVGAAVGGAVLGGSINFAINAKAHIANLKDTFKKFTDGVPNPTSAEKGALTEIEHAIHVEETNDLAITPMGRDEHLARMDVTYAALANDTPVIRKNPTPLKKKKKRESDFVDMDLMDVSTLKVDAKTFQFKSDADAQGVKTGPESLQGIEQWDEDLAGTLHVFENKKGERFVANGHQRVGLANRLKGTDPKVQTNALVKVFKEEDGWNVDDVKVRTAGINIAQGTGTPIDAAKILRTTPDKLPPMPPKSSMFRDGSNLTKLSDEAFLAATNEVIKPTHAAAIGKLVKNKDAHVAFIDLLNKEKPETLAQAESIINDALAGPFVKEINEDLFGTEVLTQTLFKERSKVLEATTRELRKNKQLFKQLVDEEKKITSTGDNVLDSEANKRSLSGTNRVNSMLNDLAHRKGKISDALTSAAKEFRKTGDLKSATADFTDNINRAVHEGAIRRESISRPGSISDAAEEASASSVSRGTELETFSQKIDSAQSSLDTSTGKLKFGENEASVDDDIISGVGEGDTAATRKLGDVLAESESNKKFITSVEKDGIDVDRLEKEGFSDEQIVQSTDLQATIKKDLLQEGMKESEVDAISRTKLVEALQNQKEDTDRKLFNTVNVQKRFQNEFQRYQDMYGDDVRDFTEPLNSMIEHDGFTPFPSWKNRFDNVKGQAHRMFVDSLQKFETKAAGLYNPATGKVGGVVRIKEKTGLDEIVHEMFDADTKSVAAKEMAQEYRNVVDFMHRKATEVGIDMPKASDYRLPNPAHDASLLFRFGKDEWVKDAINYMDWDKMTRPKTGTKIPEAERAEVLSGVFETLVSDGKNTIKTGGSSLLDHLRTRRFLKFKDGNSYLEYSKKYTSANPFEHMVDHIDKMSRDIALAETFGPDPIATKNWMKQFVLKKAADVDIKNAGKKGFKPSLPKVKAKMNKFDAMFQRASDTGDMTENIMSNFVGGSKNILASSFLPAAVISAISDFPKAGMARRGLPLPTARMMKLYMKQINPASDADRRLATRAELVNEIVNLDTNSSARWLGEVHGPAITRRIADASMRLNLLSPHTRALKRAFALDFMGKFADDHKKGFGDLDGFTKKIFERNNITEKDWNLFRSTQVNKLDKEFLEGNFKDTNGFLMPADLRERKDVNPELANSVADKFMHMINNQKNLGIVDESIRSQTFFAGTAARGSFSGILASSAGFLKSFPTTITRQIARETQSTKGIGNKMVFGASMIGGMTIAGGLSEQIAAIAKGRDPESVRTPDFWKKAFLRGGSGGAFDILFEGLNRFGGGLGKEISGPHLQLGTDLANLTMGNAAEALEGKKKVAERVKAISVKDVDQEDLNTFLKKEFKDKEIRILEGKKGALDVRVPGISSKQVSDLIKDKFNVSPRRRTLKEEEFEAFGIDPSKITVGGVPGEITEADKDTNILREAAKFAQRYSPSASGPYSSLVFSRMISDQLLQAADKKNTEKGWARDAQERFKETGQKYWWPKGSKKPLRSPDFGAMFKTPEQLQEEKGFEFKGRGRPKKKKRNRTGGKKE